MVFYFGAHISREKTLVETFETLRLYQGNALQIFISNPRSGRISTMSKKRLLAEAKQVQTYMKQNDTVLWIHSPYVMNIAKPFHPNAYWIRSTIEELEIANQLGAQGVIIHMGKYVSAGSKDMGVENMQKALHYILQHISKTNGKAKLVLETCSGMGSELFPKLDEFCAFYKKMQCLYPSNIGVCVDTAHVWAAGYDPSTALKQLTKTLGIRNILIVQLNNHPKSIGSRIDRHECILSSRGRIPIDELKRVVKWCKDRNIHVIMETHHNCYQTELPFLSST